MAGLNLCTEERVMKNIVFNYLFALVVALALAGCNSDSSSSGADDVAFSTPTTQPQSPTPSETDPETDPPMQSADPLVPVAGEGYAQKGPYQTGATVTVQELRSEEHTSELQSRPHLVCRLLLEKKKKKI